MRKEQENGCKILQGKSTFNGGKDSRPLPHLGASSIPCRFKKPSLFEYDILFVRMRSWYIHVVSRFIKCQYCRIVANNHNRAQFVAFAVKNCLSATYPSINVSLGYW